MANVTIRDLPVGTDPADVDEFVYNDDGVDRRISKDSLRNSLEVWISKYTTDQLATATSLRAGNLVRTPGYYAGWAATASGIPEGGNHGIVEERDGSAEDGGSIIFIAGTTLQVRMIFPNGVNVKQFGAKGDNIQNDTAFIQNAFNYKKSSLLRSVHFPGGNYLVDGTIDVSSTNISTNDFFISITGDSAVIKQQSNDVDTFYLHRGGDDDNSVGWIIHDTSGLIVSYSGITRSNTGAAFKAKKSLSSKYNSIVVRGAPYAFYEQGCGQTRFDNIYVQNLGMTIGEYGQSAWYFTNNADVNRCFGIFMTNCEQQGPAGQGYRNSIRTDSIDGLYCSNCHFNNAQDMVFIDPDGSTLRDVVKQLFFNNVYFDGNLWANQQPLSKVSISAKTGGLAPDTIDIEGLYFSNCFFRLADYGIISDKSAASDGYRNISEISLVNCEFRQIDINYFDVTVGIDDLNLIENIKLLNNVFQDGPAGGSGVSGNPIAVRLSGQSITFQGNSITGDWYDAGLAPVVLTSETSKASLTGNTFNTNRKVQIVNNSSDPDIVIQGNPGYKTEAFGSFTGTTDANGLLTIPHGLVDTPVFAEVVVRGDNVQDAVPQTVGQLNIIARIRNTTTNADITGVEVTVQWRAML